LTKKELFEKEKGSTEDEPKKKEKPQKNQKEEVKEDSKELFLGQEAIRRQ